MKDKVRIGLFGYGKVAELHAKAIQALPNGTLAAVCGRNRERRDAFAAKWGIASRETPAGMVKNDGVDAVIVSTPHPQHCAATVAALEAGCHVIVEKPMAVSIAECERMIAAAETAGRQLSVMSQRRWFPACVRIKKAIEEGKIGKPMLLQVTILGWRDEQYYKSDPWRGKWDTEGGGILINQAAHQIDLMHWLMGGIAEVKGFVSNINHPYIEVEDSAVAAIRFTSGGMGSVLVSNSQKPGIYAKVQVHGSSGASVGVQTDGGAMFIAGMSGIVDPPVNDLWTIPGEESLLEQFRAEDTAFFKTIDATVYFFTLQLEDFCRAIIDNGVPAVSAFDGMESVKFITDMYKTIGH
jgi:predicted dehydrogenase